LFLISSPEKNKIFLYLVKSLKIMDIYLREFQSEDYHLLSTWHQDSELYELTAGNKYFYSHEHEKKWIEDKIHNSSTQLYCAICLKKTNEMIGYVGITDIDLRNRKAIFNSLVIGSKDYRGKGIATKAVILILDYAFFELGLNRITSFYMIKNKVSQLVGKFVGFKEEGILKQWIYKNNQFHDVIIASILKSNYEKYRTKL
jgi:RimJ/RimL family protein N-acetyltransferase